MTQTHVTVRVEGHVQGVGFRQFTYKNALRLGLTGWVRNMSDGAVEAVAEGSQEQIEEWLTALKQGPPASRVDGLTIRRGNSEETFDRFEVRF